MFYQGKGGPSIPTELTGASLAQRRRGWSPLERAAFAAAWIEGKVRVPELTAQAIIAMVGANASYTYAMRNLSDETRALVCEGLCSLPTVKPKPMQLDLPLAKREMSNHELVAMVKSVGVERAFAAIEAAGLLRAVSIDARLEEEDRECN